MKTIRVNQKDIERKWYMIDAEGKILGKVAEKVATLLRGKHKPQFAPNAEIGDYVVVVNADKAVVTGRKKNDKMYYKYSGYPGGMRSENYAKMIERKPVRPMELAVKGMLPKGPLGRKLFTNVKIYSGVEHKHGAQNPEVIEL